MTENQTEITDVITDVDNQTEETTIVEEVDTAEESISAEETDITVEKKQSIFQSKKFIIPVVVIVLLLLSGSVFAGIQVHNIKKVAIELNAEIEAITEVSLSDGEKLNALQERYDQLSDFQKKSVTSYDTLQKAKMIQEALYVGDRVEKMSFENFKKNILSVVEDAGKTIFDISADDLNTIEEYVKELKEQYENLSDFQKQYVSDSAKKSYEDFDSMIKLFDTLKATKYVERGIAALTTIPEPTLEPTSEIEQGNTENTFYIEPYTIKHTGNFISTDSEGNAVIVMNFNFTNSSSEATTFRSAINLTLYQDGIQLEPCYKAKGYDISSGLQTKIRDGASLDVQMAYTLRSKTSVVEFEMKKWYDYNSTPYKGELHIN